MNLAACAQSTSRSPRERPAACRRHNAAGDIGARRLESAQRRSAAAGRCDQAGRRCDHNSRWMRRISRSDRRQDSRPTARPPWRRSCSTSSFADGAWAITVATMRSAEGLPRLRRRPGGDGQSAHRGARRSTTVARRTRVAIPPSTSTAWSIRWRACARLAKRAGAAQHRPAAASCCSKAGSPADAPAAARRTRRWRSRAPCATPGRCWRCGASKVSKA